MALSLMKASAEVSPGKTRSTSTSWPPPQMLSIFSPFLDNLSSAFLASYCEEFKRRRFQTALLKQSVPLDFPRVPPPASSRLRSVVACSRHEAALTLLMPDIRSHFPSSHK